ncbi:hypothetical protein BF2512_34 [Dickeya phage BF25/12]|uniref:Uncharacterized protein n=1 Tax=Dickeya phage BF25/12 TaxID=1698708 RepID=A0A219MHN4_9CAUD|nr:Gp5.5-like host HNS inhibition [Dickeya phage BF25/12]ALA46491.1 hypothetical protein BF2512_34 [Dickeya phage BF25/12]
MSKTFTGTVSFDFSLVLSTDSVADVLQYIQSRADSGDELDSFQKYVVGCETDDERILALWKQAMRTQIKGYLQEVHDDTISAGHGDSFKFSPITVTVKGKA